MKRAEKLQKLISGCNEDPIAVSELRDSIVSDQRQYLQNVRPTIIVLADRMNKGTFDERLALNAFDNVASVGARRYDTDDRTKKGMAGFATPCVRAHAAKDLLEHYQSEIKETAREIRAKGIKKVRIENDRRLEQLGRRR